MIAGGVNSPGEGGAMVVEDCWWCEWLLPMVWLIVYRKGVNDVKD